MNDSLCVFRLNVRRDNDLEVADCGLLQRVTDLHQPGLCAVSRAACEACSAHHPVKTFLKNPVLLSALYNACDEGIEVVENDENEREKLAALQNWAEQIIVAQAETPPANVEQREEQPGTLPENHIAYGAACDVILCVDLTSEITRQYELVIQSLLTQQHVFPVLHMIAWDEESLAFCEQYRDWNVLVHQLPDRVHPIEACHRIAQKLRTPYVALQFPHSISYPHRLAASLIVLIDEGADLIASPVDTPQGVLFAQSAMDTNETTLPVESLVFRRSTFVDLGGCGTGHDDLAREFISRALSGGYRLSLAVESLVKLDQSASIEPSSILVSKLEKVTTRELRQRALQFGYQPVTCDVVIPFHGHLDYTAEALESVLQQEQAKVVVHLVDDATPGQEVVDFLDQWSAHPQVRTYRNVRNLGQFTSFNNVSAYFETEFAAVQDADDISLPHRIYEAVNMLRLTNADFYGAAVECFGDEYVLTSALSVNESERHKRQSHRYSCYPLDRRIDYFIENPTAVFRVSLFREMGGYADFGSNLTNRASLDTEFLCRCRFSQVPFAVSREIVVRYRVHPNSATQNKLTGWGTGPRAQAARNVEKLFEKYRTTKYQPRQFGALGRYADATIKYEGPS